MNTNDSLNHPLYTYAAGADFETGHIESDYDMRNAAGASRWHKGLDLRDHGQGADQQRGDAINSPEDGTIVGFVHTNYKYLIIDGEELDFGYGHIFSHNEITNTSTWRSGNFVLVMSAPDAQGIPRPCIVNLNTCVAYSRFPNRTVIMPNNHCADTLTTTDQVGEGEAFAPIGGSRNNDNLDFPVHLHLYKFRNPQAGVTAQNCMDPLVDIMHPETEYTLEFTFNTSIEARTFSNWDQTTLRYGNRANTVAVRASMDSVMQGFDASRYTNAAHNLDSISILIQRPNVDTFEIIEGPYYNSEFLLHAKDPTPLYPNVLLQRYGSSTLTGISPYAYRDGVMFRPHDNYYYADFETRIHTNDPGDPDSNGARPDSPRQHAYCPANARYGDGAYNIMVEVKDVRDSTNVTYSDTLSFTIDNFMPYVESVIVTMNDTTLYTRHWTCNDQGNTNHTDNCIETEEPVQHPKNTLSDTLVVQAETSEPMDFLHCEILDSSAMRVDTLIGTATDSSYMAWSFNFGVQSLDHDHPYTLKFTGEDISDNELLDLRELGGSTLANCVQIPIRQDTGQQVTDWNPRANDTGHDDVHVFTIAECASTGNFNHVSHSRSSTFECLDWANLESSVVDASSSLAADGSITLTIPTGAPNYTITWEDSEGQFLSSNQNISNLAPGDYCFFIEDEFCCRVEDCVQIGYAPTQCDFFDDISWSIGDACADPYYIQFFDFPGSSDTLNDVLCHAGTCWPVYSGDTITFFIDTANVYDFAYVNYQQNCTDTLAGIHIPHFDIDLDIGPGGPIVTGGGFLPSCFTQCNNYSGWEIQSEMDTSCAVVSSAFLFPDGVAYLDEPAILYEMSSNVPIVSSAVSINLEEGLSLDLSPGIHSYIAVFPNSQCFEYLYFTIPHPSIFDSLTTVMTDESCTGANGSIALTVHGGGTMQYEWSNGDSTATASNLSAGEHTVTITNSDGCTNVRSFTVDRNDDPTAFIDVDGTVTDATCNKTDGEIDMQVNQGTGITYLWSTGATSSRITDLAAGDYVVTVTDVNDCSLVDTFVVEEDIPFDVVVENIMPDCPSTTIGNSNLGPAYEGWVVLSVDGQGPFTYLWDNGITSSNGIFLEAGYHTVTVTEDDCEVVTEVFVPIVDSTITDIIVDPIQCENPGRIELQMHQPESYTFEWSFASDDTPHDHILDGIVSPGLYVVSLTPNWAGYCTETESVYIWIEDENDCTDGIVATITNLCDGSGTGSIDLQLPPSSKCNVVWDDGSTGTSLDTTQAGEYCADISTDNCTITRCYTIHSTSFEEFLDVSHVAGVALCGPFGWITPYTPGSITITPDPNMPEDVMLEYEWSTGSVTNSTLLYPGSWASVTITDTNSGCSVVQPYSVRPCCGAGLAVPDTTIVHPSEPSATNGQIDLGLSNPFGSYNVNWFMDGDTVPLSHDLSLSGLGEGTYDAEITNGCDTITQQFVLVACATAMEGMDVDIVVNDPCVFQNQNSLDPGNDYSFVRYIGHADIDIDLDSVIRANPAYYPITVQYSLGTEIKTKVFNTSSSQDLSFRITPIENAGLHWIRIILNGGCESGQIFYNVGTDFEDATIQDDLDDDPPTCRMEVVCASGEEDPLVEHAWVVLLNASDPDYDPTDPCRGYLYCPMDESIIDLNYISGTETCEGDIFYDGFADRCLQACYCDFDLDENERVLLEYQEVQCDPGGNNTPTVGGTPGDGGPPVDNPDECPSTNRPIVKVLGHLDDEPGALTEDELCLIRVVCPVDANNANTTNPDSLETVIYQGLPQFMGYNTQFGDCKAVYECIPVNLSDIDDPNWFEWLDFIDTEEFRCVAFDDPTDVDVSSFLIDGEYPVGLILTVGPKNGSEILHYKKLPNGYYAPIWIRSILPYTSQVIGEVAGIGVAINSQNDIIGVSGFTQSVFLSHTSHVLDSKGKGDGLVTTYDVDGNLQWYKQIESVDSVVISGLAVDSSDNIYVGGNFENLVHFSANDSLSASGASGFLVKYSSSDSVLFAVKTSDAEVLDIATAVDGTTYTLSYEVNSGTSEIAVTEWTSAGVQGWSRTVDTSVVNVGKIDVLSGGRIFVVYEESGTSNSNVSKTALFSDEGEVLSTEKLGEDDEEIVILDVATDSADHVFIVGHFQDTLTQGSTTLTSRDSSDDVVLANYDASHSLDWVRAEGGTVPDIGKTIAANDHGVVVYAGYFTGDSTTLEGRDYIGLPNTPLIFVEEFTENASRIANPSTGINEALSANVFSVLSIQPNPATDQVRVRVTSANATKLHLALHDMQGRRIRHESFAIAQDGMQTVVLSVADIIPGVYILSISDDNGNTVPKKLAIQ